MKRALVLEGGAMRGIYTAGVLDVFMENEIEFDGIIGVIRRCIVWYKLCFQANWKNYQILQELRAM